MWEIEYLKGLAATTLEFSQLTPETVDEIYDAGRDFNVSRLCTACRSFWLMAATNGAVEKDGEVATGGDGDSGSSSNDSTTDGGGDDQAHVSEASNST